MYDNKLLRQFPHYNQLYHRGLTKFTAFGMHQGEKVLLTAGFDVPLLFVAADYLSAQNMLRQLKQLNVNALYLPFAEEPLLHRKSLSNAFVFSLSAALNGILRGVEVVITCAEGLCQPLPAVEQFAAQRYCITAGEMIELTALTRKLVQCGYHRTDVLTNRGEFTVRGDIVDVYPADGEPIRINYDFDVVASLRYINDDLTGGGNAPYLDIYPLAYTVTEQKLEYARQEAARLKLNSSARTRINTILGEIAVSPFSRWLSYSEKQCSLNEYLPLDTLVLWEEPKLLQEKVRKLYTDYDSRICGLLDAGEVLPFHANALLPQPQTFTRYDSHRQIALQQLNYGGTFFTTQEIISFNSTTLYNYQYNPRQLALDYEQWAKTGYTVLVFAGSEESAKATQHRLTALGVCCCDNYQTEEQTGNNAVILPYFLEKGFVSHSAKLVAIGAKDIGAKTTTAAAPTSVKRAMLSVSAGDYVVHELHGIGRCEGITTLSGSWGTKDFILVTYKNNDKLYVPVTNASSLSRFSGSDRPPALSALGGKDFEKVKAKVKSEIKAMSFDLLALYAARTGKRTRKYDVDNYLCKAFADSFPYPETPDQHKSIAEIDADLTSNDIMDRLLVGDVGYGKTEVALRTAFKVISNGYQAALLAPTTILAEQHFQTARERYAAFGIKTECLNRFRTAKQQQDILNRLAKGDIDMIIGTHRLLSSDVRFANLALLVLDEEQRFGVEHKEKLKLLKKDVDVLTLSATPIPRTLYMGLAGIRNISVINTPPLKRIAVETFVIEENFPLLREVILRELQRDGQVFLVYNRVDSIEYFTSRIRDLVPEAKIAVAHGQMDSVVLENAVYSFATNKTNLLISTTIIENGIDMPNANTLIVYDADNLGLAQLYQLRGRVGRSDRPAYAYFVYRRDKVLSQTAYERLSSIMEYNQLGSGFKIAMKDLEIRGAGNVLGAEQHGNLQKVGYDMYTRLLKEAVAELKGTPPPQSGSEVTIECNLPLSAPQTYIASAEQRMSLYNRASAIDSLAEADTIREQLIDVYGTPPQSVENFLTAVKIKLLASHAGISDVKIERKAVTLHFISREYLLTEQLFTLLAVKKSTLTLDSKQLNLRLTPDGASDDVLNQTLTVLLAIAPSSQAQ